MAQRVLGRGPPRPYSQSRGNRIAIGAAGRRYRSACRRAERYAWILRQARRLTLLFFALTQTLGPVRRFFGSPAYSAVHLGFWIRAWRPRGGAAVLDEALRVPTAPLDRQKLHQRITTALAFLAAGIIFFALATQRIGLEVILDGKSIGYVANQDVMEDSVHLAADEASRLLGYSYAPSSNIQYQFSIVHRNKIFDRRKTVDGILAQIPEIGRFYTLRIDGETIGANEDKALLEALLDRVLASHSVDGTVDNLRFVNQVSLDYGLAARSTLRTEDELSSRLDSVAAHEVRHTVAPGDTAASIAAAFALSVETLRELNWDVNIDELSKGQSLLVQKRRPILSVAYDVSKHHTEKLPCETRYIEDNSLWLGETAVRAEGASGRERVYTLQSFVDGYAQPVQVVRREALDEPVGRVILVGTKLRVATGTFIRPTNGRFTSGFGYRAVFGRFHEGADFANAVGTPIAASDGGVVTFSGVKSGYGTVVYIDHGNGFSTRYAHCSKSLVHVGQEVGQGEIIAKVGNTGRSTGPHLHFEVYVNNVPKNPMLYLR